MLARSAIVFAATFVVAAAPAVSAQSGFWDPGLLDGGWRSDYVFPDAGTPARPLSYSPDCPFPQTAFAICPGNFVPIPGIAGAQPVRSFARSNWVSRPVLRTDRHWVVAANVEPALDSNCNSGPPDQSEAVVRPFEGIFGVDVQPATAIGRPYQNEAVLAVDLSHRPRQLETRPACQTREYVPYLGFGIDAMRGGGGRPLAVLGNGAPSPVLRFNYRLVDSNAEIFGEGEAIPARPRGQYAGVFVEAQWGGRKHFAWVDLVKTFEGPVATAVYPWNWTVRESFFYPGAEIAFTSGPTLQTQCGAEGFDLPSLAPATYSHRQPVPVRIDLQRLFQCVGNRFSIPYPQGTPVPITGLQFFVEVGVRERDGLPGLSPADYDSRLGVAFDSIDIVPSAGTPASSDGEYVAQLGRDLLGREWPPAQRAHWLQRMHVEGRTAATAEMLRALEVRNTAIDAARLNLVAFDHNLDLATFQDTLARLRGGQGMDVAATALAQGDAFSRGTAALGDEAFVRLMFQRVLGVDVAQHPESGAIGEAFGSLESWVARLRAGTSGRADVLLAAFRLALARDLLLREAEVVTLYRVYFGVLPDGGGIGYWRTAKDMPERLIELLYYTPEYRARFGLAG